MSLYFKDIHYHLSIINFYLVEVISLKQRVSRLNIPLPVFILHEGRTMVGRGEEGWQVSAFEHEMVCM